MFWLRNKKIFSCYALSTKGLITPNPKKKILAIQSLEGIARTLPLYVLMRPNQQFFSYVRMISCLPRFNEY